MQIMCCCEENQLEAGKLPKETGNGVQKERGRRPLVVSNCASVL